MNKIIKIEISIENEFQTGFKAEMTINDTIFTDYEHLLSYEHIEDCYKKAMRKLESFTMLTATLLTYNDGVWRLAEQEIVSSFRYTNRFGEVKRSRLNGNSYDLWQDDSVKNILKDIKEMVNIGNRKYIELIKLKTA
jgi:hypothetical protein